MPEIVAAHLERVARELVDAQRVELWESQQAYEDAKVALAAALAACAREERLDEAKWWRAQIDSRLHGVFFRDSDPTAARRLEDERIAALERAVREKAPLDPQGGQHDS